MNSKSYILNFLSADEQKLSALILCTFLLAVLAVYECITVGDVPIRLKDLIETLVFCISGINVAGKIGSNFGGKEVKKDETGNTQRTTADG